MKRTGVVKDPLFIKHNPGLGHPESPARLEAIYSLIENKGLLQKMEVIQAIPASKEEVCRVHKSDYYDRVKACDGQEVALDPDTITSADSYRAAALAAGGTIALVEKVVKGELNNGYALIRPPGHHAEAWQAMGFCLFNNVAIAAEHALNVLGLKKVLIVDWDLHHGNGTMHSFFGRSDVVYFSTHQYPYYPGTGAVEDVGTDEGQGYTINVPLGMGQGDQEFRAIFREVLLPVVKDDSPDLIIGSTGFDTYGKDPLGGMKMTAEGYGVLTHELMQMAEISCNGKLVLALEGGYHLDGLSRGVAFCIEALLGEYQPEEYLEEVGLAAPHIKAAKQVLSNYWNF